MSLLLNQPPKLCFRKRVLVRSSPHLSYLLVCADPCAANCDKVVMCTFAGGPTPFEEWNKRNEKDLKLCREISKEMGTIGSSNGWVPISKDGVLHLREMNVNHDVDPKRIMLPPLVTLPHCQSQYVTNVAMSSSPEEEDCVVAVKFLGPQLSFCRPATSNSEWINVRISNPCFFSSPVMFSKKDDMFRIAGSGGHLIGSWDLHKHSKLQSLRFQNLPELTKTKRDLLDSCYTSQHLVESKTTSETFMVKWYKKTQNIIKGIPRMKTQAIMVFKLDDEGNAVYTQDIGDQSIFLTMSEGFCVPRSSHLCRRLLNRVKIFDLYEDRYYKLADQ
ncbi:hypothetical protein V5N11_024264 [Cardamine amara subsp. amara]|uniref:KIB1-4 beta-propeller domain-containing protein n=1 Tax=Cardamine amara subsp. amara TaxID=228776 RepID=A0ABD1BAV3_CARAN